MKIATLLAAAAVSAFALRDPVFSQEWTSVTASGIVLNQGGEPGKNNDVCCDYTAPNCKVQIENIAAREYFDYKNNRTAIFPSQGGGTVTLYDDHRVYSVNPETMECIEYCPTSVEADNNQMYPFGPAGPILNSYSGNFSGKPASVYMDHDVIPGLNITMEIETWYVQLNGANGPDTPIANQIQITPFGGPAIGVEHATYSQYVAGTPDPSKFSVKIGPHCQQAQNCGGSSADVSTSRFDADTSPAEPVRAYPFGRHAVKDSALNFPQQWTSVVVQHLGINQGGELGPNNAICCPKISPGCKVQTGYSATKQYFDLPNNRTATFSAAGGGVVTLFNEGKEYSVDASGKCQAFCPIQGGMYPFGIPSDAKDKGPSTYKGIAAELYTTTESFPILNVTMSSQDFYLDTTGATVKPVAFVLDQTPFGEHIGGQSTMFQDFAAGAPDASRFVVNGKAQCQEAQNCGGSEAREGSELLRQLMAQK